MSIKESGIRERIASAIQAKYGPNSVIYVNHGSAYSVVGRPDLDGCVLGRHVAFEVKNEEGKLTGIQAYHLSELKQAGAIAIAVKSSEEALKFLDQQLTMTLVGRGPGL